MTYNTERASSHDVGEVIPLIMEAYGVSANFICASDDGLIIKQRLIEAFSLDVLTSYHNFNIIKCNGCVVAVVSCVGGDKVLPMNKNFAAYLLSVDGSSRATNTAMELNNIQEAGDEAYYLDVLAVNRHYRGKGLASILVEHAVQRAREEKFELVLLYAEDRLRSFYERNLFAFSQKVLFGGKEYNQMCRKC